MHYVDTSSAIYIIKGLGDLRKCEIISSDHHWIINLVVEGDFNIKEFGLEEV